MSLHNWDEYEPLPDKRNWKVDIFCGIALVLFSIGVVISACVGLGISPL